MFIHILFHVCLCVIVLSLRSDSDYNKEATYLLTYLLKHYLTLSQSSNSVHTNGEGEVLTINFAQKMH